MPDQTIPLAHAVAQMVRPRPSHRLLFAHDELMNETVIRERCPDPVFITTARIPSRRFIVNSDGLASILPRRDFTVHGAIWEIDDIAMTCLRLQLDVPSVYDRIGAFARHPSGQLIISEFYATRNRQLGSGHPSYLSIIVDAARHWGFPDAYVQEVEQWECRTGRPHESKNA